MSESKTNANESQSYLIHKVKVDEVGATPKSACLQ